MNEAERYLEEKLNPPVHKTAKPVQPLPVSSDSGISSQTQSASVQSRNTATPAGRYFLAVLACLGVLVVGAMIAASMGVGGYVVMAIIFMAMIGTWKAITSKR